MFGQKPPVAPTTPATPDVWGEIHTMPGPRGGFSSAGQPAAKPPSSSGSRRWLIVAIVTVLLAIGGVGSYLAFFRATPPAPPAPVQPEPTPPVEQPLATAAARDDRRYLDVRSIQSGLELYFANNTKYPLAPLPLSLGLDSTKSLSDAGFVVPAQGRSYLAEVPKNPAPGGIDYRYESLDGTTYTITFQLEEGTAGLTPGEHRAMPQGIDGVGTVTPPAAPPQFQPPQAGTDGDGDGLTDAEEPLFGTNPGNIDSDADTFADGREVLAGYDPAKAAGALLSASTALSSFTSTKFGYTVRYPAAWLAKPVDQEESEVMLSGADGEFIEVLVTDNPEQLTAHAWYAKQVPGLTAADVPSITAGSITWAQSFDGLNAYLANGSHLITLSYNIGTKTEASYYQLFQVMVKLFQPVATPPTGTAPAGAAEGSPSTPEAPGDVPPPPAS